MSNLIHKKINKKSSVQKNTINQMVEYATNYCNNELNLNAEKNLKISKGVFVAHKPSEKSMMNSLRQTLNQLVDKHKIQSSDIGRAKNLDDLIKISIKVMEMVEDHPNKSEIQDSATYSTLLKLVNPVFYIAKTEPGNLRIALKINQQDTYTIMQAKELSQILLKPNMQDICEDISIPDSIIVKMELAILEEKLISIISRLSDEFANTDAGHSRLIYDLLYGTDSLTNNLVKLKLLKQKLSSGEAVSITEVTNLIQNSADKIKDSNINQTFGYVESIYIELIKLLSMVFGSLQHYVSKVNSVYGDAVQQFKDELNSDARPESKAYINATQPSVAKTQFCGVDFNQSNKLDYDMQEERSANMKFFNRAKDIIEYKTLISTQDAAKIMANEKAFEKRAKIEDSNLSIPEYIKTKAIIYNSIKMLRNKIEIIKNKIFNTRGAEAVKLNKILNNLNCSGEDLNSILQQLQQMQDFSEGTNDVNQKALNQLLDKANALLVKVDSCIIGKVGMFARTQSEKPITQESTQSATLNQL